MEPAKTGRGRAPQESKEGPVVDVEKAIGPIPEEKSSEISGSLSFAALNVGQASHKYDKASSPTPPTSGKSDEDGVIVDLAPPNEHDTLETGTKEKGR